MSNFIKERNERTISLHDQYLTASPYDNDPDWADEPYNISCPKCDSSSFSEEGGDYPDLEFHCDDCGHDWEQDVDKPPTTLEQAQKISELQHEIWDIRSNRKRLKGQTVDEFFDTLGIEGDFNWDSEETGDWHVYCCHEKDCPVQWHTVAYSEKIGRENGKRYLILYSVDSDGNWDLDCGYDEREGDEPESFEDVSVTLINQADDFFLDWAQYWLDAAQTGKDPCNQTLNHPDNWVEFCIEAVEDNLKYYNYKTKIVKMEG